MCKVERDALAGVAGHGPALAGRLGDDDVVVTDGHGAELTGLDDEGDPERRVVTSATRSAAPIAAATRGLLAEPLPERSEVGLDADVDQARAVVSERLQRTHVQLLGNLLAQVVRQRRPAGSGDERPPQWLPRAHAGRRPRRPAELDQSPHEVHALAQLDVDQVGDRLGP